MADSRMDLILKKLNGEDVELVPPMSRIEKIYFKLLGYDIELDPPQSRSEVLLTEYVNNGGGGGGSSDFSIAHVTMTNTATHPFLIEGPCLADDGMYHGIPSEFIDGSSIDIAMYKGWAYLVFASEYSDYDFALTGDITKDGTDIYVTGDGTITITDSK